MASIALQTTADQLLAIPDDGRRYELMAGELRVMSPAGNEHGKIALKLAWRVAGFVEEHRLGETFAAETGFLIARNPDTVRAPNFAFITQQRIDDVGSVAGYWPGAPDLLAEVVSPGDSFSEVEAKTLGWLEAGTKVVWVVDPGQRHVTVYRSPADITVIESEGCLEAPDLLPGWSVAVKDLFPK
jgi:Uma2 family endonuclease